MRKMIYVASPYAKLDKESAIREAKEASLLVKRMGQIPVSTILAWDGVYDEKTSEDRDIVCDDGLELLSRCDGIYIHKCDGWETSEGMKSEIEYAKMKGIPKLRIEVVSTVYDVRFEK